MSSHPIHAVLALTSLLVTGSATAQGTIKDYLFTHNAGPVAANDIIGVSKSVVSDLQTPRELALSVGNFGDRDTQNGFGLSFTPGRSGFNALAVAADKYRNKDDWLRRIWGGTTFSYAQNRKKISSSDYDQSALAVSTTFLLEHTKDPIVAAYTVLATSGEATFQCKKDGLDIAADEVDKDQDHRVKAFVKEKGVLPKKDELEAIKNAAQAANDGEAKALAVRRSCAQKVAGDVEKEWNASRVQLMLGRGWIKPEAAGGRIRLATHAKVALALGAGDDGLFNLTWRRAGDELDLTTLGAMPAYKNTNSAAIRYTYKASKGGDMFALAEVSNVKASTTTASQADFKRAVGLDKMFMPGLWLEFRYGRAQTVGGTGLENKALLTLKFSEDTSLDKQIK